MWYIEWNLTTRNIKEMWNCHSREMVQSCDRQSRSDNLRVKLLEYLVACFHDDVIKWKHFPRYWPLVRGIHRWPVNSPHKGQWRGASMFSLICLNKRLDKQSRGWWFEKPSRRLWRHYNVCQTTKRMPSHFMPLLCNNDLIKRQENTIRHKSITIISLPNPK